jgi:SAM-dependent methyltransferase
VAAAPFALMETLSYQQDFLESAELYDAIYHFKNYQRESERLREITSSTVPAASSLLDVACGTGAHDKFLKEYFQIDGIDLNGRYLDAARARNPAGRYVRADMTNFDLGRRYDVVTCLFSAIGYLKAIEPVHRAIACMARHVGPRGALIIEPWITPDRWKPGTISINNGETPDGIVCRMALSRRQENRSVMSLHYLHGTRQGVRYYTEQLELGLFTRDEMKTGFERAGMRVLYDTEGLMGRGLYIGTFAQE